MKIYIIGPAGSGKTTLANKISEKTGIKSTTLDDIFWSNEENSFGIKREKEERDSIYENVLNNDSWIIEGAYIEWPKKGLYQSDNVIYLNIKESEINKRIIKRFISRKLGIQKSSKKETIKGLRNLIKWNKDQIKDIKVFIDRLENENTKVIKLNNNIEISRYLESI
jgi:adenylate kinase family enzyme